MVKFLIKRPIAVIMSFIAVVILGITAIFELPVSLMPDISVPEITIQVSLDGASVREVQQSVVNPMRTQLIQVSGLEDFQAESRDGNAIIRLRFDYDTDIDMAFIDVSEKIDNAMRSMPKDMERPQIIKASVTDIPAFTLNVQIKDEGRKGDDLSFMELGTLCESVIKRRLEQLPDVALVDMTGRIFPEVYIIPDSGKMNNLGISQQQIASALNNNNISFGNIEVQEGQYRYSIKFSSFLQSVDDIKRIYLKVHDRIFQLKEIAEIGIRPSSTKGMYLSGGTQALGMAIVKQKDARMSSLKDEVDELLKELGRDYPELSLELSQDQTGILSYTISNLKQSLLLGAMLAFLVMFLFLKDIRSPMLIGFSVPTSLVISLLVFYLLGMSINIISLSGLILGVGMMIDNSIIVIDNITQYIDKRFPLHKACIKGTTEVIRPLLSSVLSTCVVFLPLVFLSGISGALFYDQAMAVTIGLFASLAVAVVFIPILYSLFYKKPKGPDIGRSTSRFMSVNVFNTTDAYTRGFDFVFRYRKQSLLIFIAFIALGVLLFMGITKEKLPEVAQNEIVLKIDWNSSINLTENQTRVQNLLTTLGAHIKQSNSYIAMQQFLLSREHDQGSSETRIYLQGNSEVDIKYIKEKTLKYFTQTYPEASYEFTGYKTVFDRLFPDDEPEILARISSVGSKQKVLPNQIDAVQQALMKEHQGLNTLPLPREEHIVITLNYDKLVWYDIKPNKLIQKLQTAFNSLQVDLLRSNEHLPIVISEHHSTITETLKQLFIKNNRGNSLPVSSFISVGKVTDYKTLYTGKDGDYIPLPIAMGGTANTNFIRLLEKEIKKAGDFEVQFSGEIFSGNRLIEEMIWVFMISVLLLYFILAAQFESVTQPLIVLLEIPIDIAGALGLLYLFGGSLNLMSLIGIIVMCGIIINDSILKIDTINRLRKDGLTLKRALHQAGERRLKPILMTSITTILALVPFLFGSDLGSELQKPLALAVIGGMILGTLVSLYFIPLAYYYLYKNKKTVI
ncbi:efflux RND transporter permease subunit [Zhouia amylolytica]|uniref:Cation/multidrug efflux pump n=1 Tax=Zhouia amylolytica AD3 TaxID=1286632 RepID=W2USC9_9FLAO|nr:efflux RND transporter permease subunit [Zhouia amylolytica]ETN96376.1 hypothetical protein P278_07200 [Zhouia amylolytica AD3]